VTEYCHLIGSPKSEERAAKHVKKLSGRDLKMPDFFQVIGMVFFIVQVAIIIHFCWQPRTENSSPREIALELIPKSFHHHLCFKI
jgi:hypothetical protein